jgi:DNA invertase Pin-like site-specific DNA recombinase
LTMAANRSKGAAREAVNPRHRYHDTGTSTGRLMLAVLGGLADVERDLIRTRTAEGRNGNHQTPGAGGRIGPWAPPMIELSARVHDALDDGK